MSNLYGRSAESIHTTGSWHHCHYSHYYYYSYYTYYAEETIMTQHLWRSWHEEDKHTVQPHRLTSGAQTDMTGYKKRTAKPHRLNRCAKPFGPIDKNDTTKVEGEYDAGGRWQELARSDDEGS